MCTYVGMSVRVYVRAYISILCNVRDHVYTHMHTSIHTALAFHKMNMCMFVYVHISMYFGKYTPYNIKALFLYIFSYTDFIILQTHRQNIQSASIPSGV